MQTITFYSYKGGVGRSLLLANMARYLARFKQNVFVLDFDLEAPGLHYKFGVSPERGLIDILHLFATQGELPKTLTNYTLEIAPKTEHKGSVHLMPAGKCPNVAYWRKLSQINWHDLFYTPQAQGVPLFLELQAWIRQDYAPDYLLIDARTGITDLGGISTTLLSDTVVCLMTHQRESLEGTREVMRSIQRTAPQRRETPVQLLPVLTRVPPLDKSEEETLVHRVQMYLCEDADYLEDTLTFTALPVLHIEWESERQERLSGENQESSIISLRPDEVQRIASLILAQ